MEVAVLLGVFLLVTTSFADLDKRMFKLNRGVIVHLFEWKWKDIADECEEFLADHGFAGVQISPPHENMIVSPGRPWWERYRPISYKLTTRSGTEEELENMIKRCNDKHVRVFADVVLNHMTGPAKTAEGVGGSNAKPDEYDYPDVPFTKDDFHYPPCKVEDYNSPKNIRDCELYELRDLDEKKTNVIDKQVEFLNKLVDMGVAGFRIDSAKHMWPEHIEKLYKGLHDLNTKHGFDPNTRPLIYMDVIDNERQMARWTDYSNLGLVSDYRFGDAIGATFKAGSNPLNWLQDFANEAVSWTEYSPMGLVTDYRFGNALGITFQAGKNPLNWLKDFENQAKLLPRDAGLVFVDNHITQRDGANYRLNYITHRPYKMAIAFMLAHPTGTPLLLSSYQFIDREDGPPADGPDVLSPHPIAANNVCINKYNCEHRWRQVYNMVEFHNAVAGADVTWWKGSNGDQIAFCRENKGFVAFSKASSPFKQKVKTCLPKGKYCDVISGSYIDNACTGKEFDVDEKGETMVDIVAYDMNNPNINDDGVIALHAKAKILTPKDIEMQYVSTVLDKFVNILQSSDEPCDPDSPEDCKTKKLMKMLHKNPSQPGENDTPPSKGVVKIQLIETVMDLVALL